MIESPEVPRRPAQRRSGRRDVARPLPCLAATLLAAIGLATAVPLAAEEEKPEPPPQTIAELEQRIRAVLDETHTPGAGVALVDREQTIWAAGIGLADVASRRAATADTLFRIGSLSKSFVSLAVLMLVEEGRLSLETPLAQLAPEVAFENPWEATDPVRLVHLLEHTTGFDDLALAEYAHNDPTPVTLAAGLAYHPASRTSRWRPGTRYSYCNSGPAVAAFVVEKVTGRRFEDFVGERIFAPLGMTHASYFLTDEVASRLANLYHDDGTTPFPYWHILMRPAGSINASAAELARFERLLLGRGTVDGVQLLSAASIERMETPSTTWAARAGVRTGYGLGNYTTIEDGFVWHGHGGGVNGGITGLAYLPDAGVGYLFMINSGSDEAREEIGKLLRGYLTRELAKPAPATEAAVDAALAADYSGWYLPDSPRQEVGRFLERLLGLARIAVGERGMVVRPLLSENERYVAVGGRLFRGEKEPVATHVLIDDPEGGRLLQSGDFTGKRVSTVRAWAQIGATALGTLLLVTAPLVTLVCLVQRLRRRLRDGGRPGLWLWPAAPIVVLALAVGLLYAAGGDAIPRLGQRTAWSMTFCGFTLVLPVAALLGLTSAWRARRVEGVSAWLRRWSLAVALAAVALSIWLGWFGVLGWRTWA